jgi:hypothetical protein
VYLVLDIVLHFYFFFFILADNLATGGCMYSKAFCPFCVFYTKGELILLKKLEKTKRFLEPSECEGKMVQTRVDKSARIHDQCLHSIHFHSGRREFSSSWSSLLRPS